MNITDYQAGTAYINLYRVQFKDERDFERICDFLLKDKTLNAIEVPLDSFRCLNACHRLSGK